MHIDQHVHGEMVEIATTIALSCSLAALTGLCLWLGMLRGTHAYACTRPFSGN